jgi:hypothetical protein
MGLREPDLDPLLRCTSGCRSPLPDELLNAVVAFPVPRIEQPRSLAEEALAYCVVGRTMPCGTSAG